MTNTKRCRVALLYPGDRDARAVTDLADSRFKDLAQALEERGAQVEAAIYHDDFSEEIRDQLLALDGVLVWMNPIQDGRTRTVLDRLLREVASTGVAVSTHPDMILLLGTKEVLFTTKHLGWGSGTHLYQTLDEMRSHLPRRLAQGEARVLKQYRGNGGLGVWRVQLPSDGLQSRIEGETLTLKTVVCVRHAKRGCVEEKMALGEFFELCAEYFAEDGRMIDQPYQERLADGTIRAYIVGDKVAGFGHQEINALYPAPDGAPPSEAPQPGPRLYHSAEKSEFQPLRRKLEGEWIPALMEHFNLSSEDLPILWDCDFFLGEKTASGEDTYVLGEINVSSVYPYPESATPYIADETIRRVTAAIASRGTAD